MAASSSRPEALTDTQGALLMNIYSFIVGALAGYSFDRLVKTDEDILDKDGQVDYADYAQAFLDNHRDEEQVPVLDSEDTYMANLIDVSAQYVAGNNDAEILNQAQDFARGHTNSVLLIVQAIQSLVSLKYQTVKFNQESVGFDNLMITDWGRDPSSFSEANMADFRALVKCVLLVTRAIIQAKYDSKVDEKVLIGHAVASLTEGTSPELADLADNFLRHWWQRNRNTLALTFASVRRGHGPETIQDMVTLSGIGEPVYPVARDLLYSIERFLRAADSSLMPTLGNVSFFPDFDMTFSTTLVGGWYGLKYGIIDQSGLVQGIPQWALENGSYEPRDAVREADIIFHANM